MFAWYHKVSTLINNSIVRRYFLIVRTKKIIQWWKDTLLGETPSTCIRTEKDSWATRVKLLIRVANGMLWRWVEAVVCGEGLPCLQRCVGPILGSQLVLSGSLHRLLDHLLPTFHESERRNNVVFCTSMAEVICQGCYLACAQHSYKLMCEFCSINLGIA